MPVLADECEAQYTQTQCEQLTGGDSGGTTGTNGCPYYMCGNATARAQDSWGWCEATQKEENCPINFCVQGLCIGTNCYVTSITCSDCSSRAGNNGHMTDCPRQ